MTDKVSQKKAVIEATKKILGTEYKQDISVKDLLSKDQIKEIRQDIIDGILSGKVIFNKQTEDSTYVEKYVAGMISNHFRKAKELNGGSVYIPTQSSVDKAKPKNSKAPYDIDVTFLSEDLKNMVNEV